MITFGELFQDPHARELIYHIVSNIDPTGNCSDIDEQGFTSVDVRVLFYSGLQSRLRFTIDFVENLFKKYSTPEDFYVSFAGDIVNRISIRNSEILVDDKIVNFLKEFVK